MRHDFVEQHLRHYSDLMEGETQPRHCTMKTYVDSCRVALSFIDTPEEYHFDGCKNNTNTPGRCQCENIICEWMATAESPKVEDDPPNAQPCFPFEEDEEPQPTGEEEDGLSIWSLRPANWDSIESVS